MTYSLAAVTLPTTSVRDGVIICIYCTEGRQQQGGKECAGGFHCAISDSNAIRKPMEMFL